MRRGTSVSAAGPGPVAPGLPRPARPAANPEALSSQTEYKSLSNTYSRARPPPPSWRAPSPPSLAEPAGVSADRRRKRGPLASQHGQHGTEHAQRAAEPDS